jgi:hypothetical protein
VERSIQGRVAGAALAAFVIGVPACSVSPDIVATSVKIKVPFDGPDGGLKTEPPFTECQPGKYEGKATALPDNTVPITFSGSIAFSLVKTLSAEFPVFENEALLEGTGDDGSKFRAVIPSQLGCIEGKFGTELLDGIFTTVAGVEVHFDGPISGEYEADTLSFRGKWTSNLHFNPTGDPLVVKGTWIAGRVGSQ